MHIQSYQYVIKHWCYHLYQILLHGTYIEQVQPVLDFILFQMQGYFVLMPSRNTWVSMLESHKDLEQIQQDLDLIVECMEVCMDFNFISD